MHSFIVIGAPGQGKSPFVQAAIDRKRCFVFDVQNEYGSRTKYKGQRPLMLSDNPNDLRARYVPKSPSLREDIQRFMEMCRQKKDTNIVFEEATIFFEGRMGDLSKTLMVNRKHTGNVYYFIFHSINSVPPRVMEMSDYVVLHKTIDQDYTVMYKYSRLWPYFRDLQEMPDGSRLIIPLMAIQKTKK
jgi:hypothetical protein